MLGAAYQEQMDGHLLKRVFYQNLILRVTTNKGWGLQKHTFSTMVAFQTTRMRCYRQASGGYYSCPGKLMLHWH